MDIAEILIRLVLGLGIGFTIGMTGVGGGVLVVPALTEVLGFPTTLAVGTASAYAFMCKIYAGFEHFRLKTIDFKTSNVFLIGAIPGNLITAFAIIWYKTVAPPAEVASFQEALKLFIACVMVFSVGMMFFNMWRKRRAAQRGDEPRAEGQGNFAIGIVCGAVIGFLIGSTSVGGGVLVVPLLILFFGLSASRTVGSSIYIALVLTLVTTIVYMAGPALVGMLGGAGVESGGKEVDLVTAAIMAAGSIAGVYFGSRAAVKMPEGLLQQAVIVLILAAAGNMFYKCLWCTEKPAAQPRQQVAEDVAAQPSST